MKKHLHLVLRKAKEKDVQTILQFIKDLAEYENLLDEVGATEEILYDSIFKRKKSEALIVEYGQDAIGYVIYFYNFSTFTGRPGLYVEDIYIIPDMRKRGFGKEIFIHLAKLAQEENCARMEWACLNWNEPSMRFYEKMGAFPMSDWVIYRLDDEGIQALSEESR